MISRGGFPRHVLDFFFGYGVFGVSVRTGLCGIAFRAFYIWRMGRGDVVA